MTQVATAKGDDFEAVAQLDGARIISTLEGTADYAVLDDVDGFLVRLHAEARRLHVTEAVVDLRRLEFMNSSCFKSFVTWITEIQALDAANQYKVQFLSNPKLHWQKRSLQSLRCFAVELISIVEETAGNP